MQFNKGGGNGGGSATLFTGFFQGEVVLINPTKSEIETTTGIKFSEDKEEFDYEKRSKRDEDMAQISIWFKTKLGDDVKFFNKRYYLINKPHTFPNSGKNKYVNQSGMSCIAASEKDLPTWFTDFTDKNKSKVADKQYRHAIQGEGEFTEFLSRWLGKLNLWGADKEGVYANILIDRELMFKNLSKYVKTELRPLIGSEHVTETVELATVNVVDGENGTKHYQSVYTVSLPYAIKDGITYGRETMKVIDTAIKTNNWNYNPILKKYVETLTGDYGTDDAYTLTMLQVWDPSKAPAHLTDNTLSHEATNTEATVSGTTVNTAGAAFLEDEGAGY